MKILVNANGRHGCYNNWSTFDCAIIDLTSENAKKLSSYFEWARILERSESQFIKIIIQNDMCRFYDSLDLMVEDQEGHKLGFPIPAESIQELEVKGWTKLPEDFKEPLDKRLSDKDAIIDVNVDVGALYWSASMDGSDCEYYTNALGKDEIAEAF
jgi:hypothetical protein